MNKSLFRRPGTKHFQLVHRSLRDPLINDSDASDRVLKEVGGAQAKSKHAHAGPSNLAPDEETLGDAASYGIYYDDHEYNYMQHLKPVGAEINSFLIEAPSANSKSKGKAKAVEFSVLDLPEDSLPSHPLDEISYDDIIKEKELEGRKGLQPDLNPKIREVLEALDDEAYAVDDGAGTDGEEDFWNDVVNGGEVEEHDRWSEDEDEGNDVVAELGAGDGGAWDQVARFKASGARNGEGDSDDDEEMSEGGDTIAALRVSNARRLPRKAATQAGSQFSMTSSAMFRNEGLRTLDDRFDQIEKLYEEDSESSWGSHSSDEDEDAEARPTLAPAREDLDQIMDEFLSRYEVLGGKMRPVMEGETGAGKLDRIRRELAALDLDVGEGEEGVESKARRLEKERILEAVDRQEREEMSRKGGRIKMDWEKPKERWDCETVLSTYSNVSNHPRLLRVRDLDGPKPPRITIDRRTGFPIVEGQEPETRAQMRIREDEEARLAKEALGSDDDMEDSIPVETLIRPKNETPEERKARKDGIKLDRSSRRAVKKGTKEAFGNETKRQKKIASKRVAGGGAADIRVGEGVRRLA